MELTNLTETENYAVRVIAQNAHDISLPSQVIRFTTYPGSMTVVQDRLSFIIAVQKSMVIFLAHCGSKMSHDLVL